MSVIAGIYERQGAVPDPFVVKRMVRSMSYRASDGSGFENAGAVSLGHAMLHTTPESLRESQPLWTHDGRLCLTADARVDNREALIEELRAAGTLLDEDPTDAELILAAYQTWEDESPRRIVGDFAFAIWDQKKQRLFCARDPVGIKPFFYYVDGRTFRWATEPRAFFEDPALSCEPNIPLLALYLMNRFDELEETLYRNILRLPAGHFLVVTQQDIRKARYWDIDPGKTIRYRDDSEYSEHFLSLFQQSIKASLRSCTPVGSLLSGGLDSSSIVCTAQDLINKNATSSNGLETFSILFNSLPCDESKYIQAVVDHAKTRSNYFVYEETFSGCDIEQTMLYRDILYNPTLFVMTPAFQHAHQKGIRVMLTGIGSDDFLETRLEYLTDLMLQRKYRELISAFNDLSGRLDFRSKASLFINFCLRPSVPRGLKAFVNRVRGRKKDLLPFWMNRFAFHSLGLDERLNNDDGALQFKSRARQHIYESLFKRWTPAVALDVIDRFSARFLLERRYPFLDRRLIEFLFALPEEKRWSHATNKGILKRAMKETLPETVRQRTDKAEFSPLVRMEIGNRQIQKIRQILKTSRIVEYGLVNGDQLEPLLESYQRQPSVGVSSLERIIWLELWCRSSKLEKPLEKVQNEGRDSESKDNFTSVGSKTLLHPGANDLWKRGGVDRI